MIITIIIPFKKNRGLQSGITVKATPQLPCKFNTWDCWNDWRGWNKDRKGRGLFPSAQSVWEFVCVYLEKSVSVCARVCFCVKVCISLQVWFF